MGILKLFYLAADPYYLNCIVNLSESCKDRNKNRSARISNRANSAGFVAGCSHTGSIDLFSYKLAGFCELSTAGVGRLAGRTTPGGQSVCICACSHRPEIQLVANARNSQRSHPDHQRHLSLYSPSDVRQSVDLGDCPNPIITKLDCRPHQFNLFYPVLFATGSSRRKDDAGNVW